MIIVWKRFARSESEEEGRSLCAWLWLSCHGTVRGPGRRWKYREWVGCVGIVVICGALGGRRRLYCRHNWTHPGTVGIVEFVVWVQWCFRFQSVLKWRRNKTLITEHKIRLHPVLFSSAWSSFEFACLPHLLDSCSNWMFLNDGSSVTACARVGVPSPREISPNYAILTWIIFSDAIC